jgi:hypothetical protein
MDSLSKKFNRAEEKNLQKGKQIFTSTKEYFNELESNESSDVVIPRKNIFLSELDKIIKIPGFKIDFLSDKKILAKSSLTQDFILTILQIVSTSGVADICNVEQNNFKMALSVKKENIYISLNMRLINGENSLAPETYLQNIFPKIKNFIKFYNGKVNANLHHALKLKEKRLNIIIHFSRPEKFQLTRIGEDA